MHELLRVMRRNSVRYISLVTGIYLDSSVESYYTRQQTSRLISRLAEAGILWNIVSGLTTAIIKVRPDVGVRFNKIQNALCTLILDEDLRLKDCHEIATTATTGGETNSRKQ
eukprot:scaffold524501_cov38-Prasinocladus_malaysianus.AAC.1